MQIFEGGANGTLLGSAQLNGNGTWCFTTAPLADGCLTFVAEVTDQAGNGAAASVIVDDRIPAGVAGDPINLALTDPSGGQAAGPITLTVTGLPSDWSLNAGTDLGNSTWTVQTSDLSALTVTTAATARWCSTPPRAGLTPTVAPPRQQLPTTWRRTRRARRSSPFVYADWRGRAQRVRLRAADRQRHDLQFQCCDG